MRLGASELLSPLLTFPRYFHEMNLRQRIVLSQLPLAVSMLLVVIIAALYHRGIFGEPTFIWGLVGHGVILLLCTEVPWDRLPPSASLCIPFLDFVAIGLSRHGAGDALSSLAILLVFPVIWLAAGREAVHWVVLVSFLAPLAVLWIPLLAEGAPAETFTGVILLPFMMVAVGLTVRVVTASMNAQQRELEDKERLLNTIVDTVGVGVLAVDRHGHDMLWNPQQQRNHAMAAPRGNPDPNESQLLLFRPDKVTPVPLEERPVRRAVAGESFSDYLMWIGDDDSRRAVSASARTMTDDDGAFAGSVVAFSDVTELLSALSAKDDFVANISHEFRTPLTSILGYLELAADQEYDIPPDLVHYLSVAQRNTERLLRLVSDLLATTSDSMKLALEPTNISELVGNCLSSAQVQAAEASVELINDAGTGIYGEVDPSRISQVLDNLLSNAIKYSPGGGTVTVAAGIASGSLELCVADTGMGMDESDQTGLFTRFFRADTVRNSSIPGVGLGLLITKTIVDNHGGTIELHSTRGSGTTFTVRLPLAGSRKNIPIEEKMF
ncbi:sensor histidine kinase [Arthrobacter pigmenti]